MTGPIGAAREVTRQLRAGVYTSPKTILGFFAIVLAIVVSGTVGIVGFLGGRPDLIPLVVAVVVFAGLLILLIVVGVFVVAWKDPSKLMLGQISGREYVDIRKQIMGDSTSGEYEDTVIETRVAKGKAPEIGSGDDEEAGGSA